MSALHAIIKVLSSSFPSSNFAETRIQRMQEMLIRNWFLGFTSFGGPAVHFQIFNHLFVEKWKWVDVQMYQELFALCQALPGPGSTKMLFGLNVIRGGFLTATIAFFIWSLPGAFGMYGLALGVAHINSVLPSPVYALLSGLNAATVGIIALAAVQLAHKAITDKLTRILVFGGGAAGMLYNALWYFPILMVVGGAVTVAWDYRTDLLKRVRRRRPRTDVEVEAREEQTEMRDVSRPSLGTSQQSSAAGSVRRVGTPIGSSQQQQEADQDTAANRALSPDSIERAVPDSLVFSWKFGLAVIAFFFLTFIPIMTLRGVLRNSPRGFKLFANFYLAGTIIFGGGPVVIPLLREYIVAEGWVSSRDFLLGLAIIQAFPGPNFNFAVYLGSLATVGVPNLPSFAGALIGFLGIFGPGLILFIGTMGIWKAMRRRRWVVSILRGVNASAVGLVYTAVYRLWRIGFVDVKFQRGSSLEGDPWWVVITATSFVGGMWFGVSAPVAILLGGVMGMVWYGVVNS